MKTIRIPYFYREVSDESFQLETLNQGYILCRKLGLEPTSISVGRREYREIEHLDCIGSYPNYGVEMVEKSLGIKIRKIAVRKALVFNCTKYFNLQKHMSKSNL